MNKKLLTLLMVAGVSASQTVVTAQNTVEQEPQQNLFITNPESAISEHGISTSSRARKLSSIKSFYKYLTVRTKQLSENPVADLEYPKLRKSLPKYLTMVILTLW